MGSPALEQGEEAVLRGKRAGQGAWIWEHVPAGRAEPSKTQHPWVPQHSTSGAGSGLGARSHPQDSAPSPSPDHAGSSEGES